VQVAKKSHQQRLERARLERQRARQAERERRKRALVVVAAAVSVLAVVGAVVLLAIAGNDEPGDASNTPSAPASDPAADAANKPQSIPTALAPAPKRPTPLAAQVDCSYKKGAEAASKGAKQPPAGKVSARGTVPVTLKTTIGDLKLTLDRGVAPCAVHSTLSLVKQKFYDNTSCHRLTVGAGLQVLQCGAPGENGAGGPGYQFAEETWPQLKYGRGTIAMAKTPQPGTTSSQFFIVYGDGTGLTPDYTPIGTIDDAGLKLVDAVARAGVDPAGGGQGDGPPATPVRILSAVSSDS
jgi:peptidyl-prolyl cis-trans isomerase B (cyclophilin B)